jgi:hypothetical protein
MRAKFPTIKNGTVVYPDISVKEKVTAEAEKQNQLKGND